MSIDNIKALMTYRLEQADESLKAAELLLQGKLLRPSVNRAYYVMFYAVLALLASKKMETSKHSGVISLFDKEFVKTGSFPKEFSKWLHDAFTVRQRSDYSVQYNLSLQEARDVFKNAFLFVRRVTEKIRSDE